MKNTAFTFDQLLDQKYGKRGSNKRESWETDFEIFKSQVLAEQKKKPSVEIILHLKTP